MIVCTFPPTVVTISNGTSPVETTGNSFTKLHPTSKVIIINIYIVRDAVV